MEGKSLITELIQIFGYLDSKDLLQCRLVCPYWYQLIKDESRLIDKFRFNLTFNSGSVVSADEPPFSVIIKSRIKINSITIEENFLDPGNCIAVVESNRKRISALSTMLTDMMAEETVAEIIVHARDDDSRTSELLFELITKMKKMKILRFTMTAFVQCLELKWLVPCTSLEHVEIFHKDCKRLIVADFVGLSNIFPNIKRIDVKPSDAMLLGKNILIRFGPLIKSIEKLEDYTLTDLNDIDNMFLTHMSYECDAEDNDDVDSLKEFLGNHNGIATMTLKLFHLEPSSQFFDRQFPQIIDLEMTIKNTRDAKRNEKSIMHKVLKCIPNVDKLCVKFNRHIEHHFGHKTIQMKHLIHVTMTRFHLNCINCCTAMLKSLIHVKSLKLTPYNGALSLEHLTAIAQNLEKLECLELICDDGADHGNYFENWPSMPNLKRLIVNRVGYVTDNGIRNVHTKCPMLEVIKFYSLRGSRIDLLLKLTINCFPNIEAITFRGGRTAEIRELNYIQGKVGWKLKELDLSSDVKITAILKLFKQNDLLETIRCKYGSLVVTRRIYYEVGILKAYDMKSVEQPLKNRKRLHFDEDTSSDSETSGSEESSSEESTSDTDTDADDSDYE